MGERIFVVEDDENIREIINLALVSNGMKLFNLIMLSMHWQKLIKKHHH